MCTTCGCGGGEATVHRHDHDHAHADHHEHSHGSGAPEHAHASGPGRSRMVQIERDILEKNAAFAQANRARLAGDGTLALNLVSSPGSGKTTLLVETLARLKGRFPLAVIEGDQQTSRDAERIRATGTPAVQINTGKGCHLDAHMVGHALDRLPRLAQGVLFVENVGNLVCPASFDLGEARKVVILSVAEGDDKPLKYPDMFRAAQLMLLNKVDLLPYVEFDTGACVERARRIHPDIAVISLSARSGAGIDAWIEWILAERATALRGRLATLRAEIGSIESQLA
jgi:hydrogenase nickel incorporation protein HypB